MIKQHPLTDEIISKQFGRYDGIDDVMVYDEDDVRAAYDLGRDEQCEQEQEIRELKRQLHEKDITIHNVIKKLKDHGIC